MRHVYSIKSAKAYLMHYGARQQAPRFKVMCLQKLSLVSNTSCKTTDQNFMHPPPLRLRENSHRQSRGTHGMTMLEMSHISTSQIGVYRGKSYCMKKVRREEREKREIPEPLKRDKKGRTQG